MQTLIPEPATAQAAPIGRRGRAFAFGLTVRALWLFAFGFVLVLPALRHPRAIWFAVAWDAIVLALCVLDAMGLPAPEALRVTRTFLASPQLGRPTAIEIAVEQEARGVLQVRVTDDLSPALTAAPQTCALTVFPREAAKTEIVVTPRERGDTTLGSVFVRYRAGMGLVERWAAAAIVQPVRVFPAHEDTSGNGELFLLRARQIERQKRRLRMRGTGRDFESLRDYSTGDELRNVSWTATARRGKLITRQFTVERSQQVWIVLDAGRLSRTALKLHRVADEFVHETDAERDAADVRTVTQLDEAAKAAITLAQVVGASGDKVALMTYGRTVQQMLLPGTGAGHVRLMLDLLSQTKSERAEADHLMAVARLKNVQRRRGLIVWITELVDQAGRPDLVAAAAELTRGHLVLLVLLVHPELEALAARKPATAAEMYAIAAAEEMLMRRREAVALLERAGVLIVETTPEEAGALAIHRYLEIKARGQL
jgi:uncharacterized protein (DUF58 family)